MKAYHVVGQAPMYTNTFLLISEAGHGVVIDPAAAAADYGQLLRKEGASLTHIFCTHGHFDHVGSAAELKEEWNAKLWCESADLEGGQFYPLTQADSGYQEGGVIQVDEMSFTVWHTPGHTPGSVCLLCGEYLFTGDTLFAGSVGRTDLPGGSTRQLSDSLRKLAGLPIPPTAQVLPGHGDLSTFGEELKNNWYIRKSVSRQDW
ncbi:MBL fold hydrolase [Faecalibacterium sp. An58]|uniref:MBL fold metallo-hydrolase n=1 Tax=Faecalibacterium sp. An58 TaxID=1965648 RepID=UPI000B3697C0|nr:MBL fold metallo-hydrolase [Faecalibacterium sp. An58]OUN74546.1 MBL fold hydrolase [Faecalibacterium sp. An58]